MNWVRAFVEGVIQLAVVCFFSFTVLLVAAVYIGLVR